MPLFSSFSNTGKAKATFPGQPGTPSITSQAVGQVGISWTAPSFSGGAPIVDYDIEYSTNGGSTWTAWSHTPSTATSATVTGLPDYLTYTFRVKARNAVGSGNASTNSANAPQFNAASGGTEQTISNYNGTGQTWKVHTFTAGGTLSVSRAKHPFRWLTAAGGGSNGTMEHAGGGGAGGYLDDTRHTITISETSYPITIGAGNSSGSNGGNTTFAGLTLYGGGRGANESHYDKSPGSGGSGGGAGGSGGLAGGYVGGGSGFAGPPRQGYNGGDHDDVPDRPPAGGGGANGRGGHSWEGGAGGPGATSNISGSSLVYCAGGRGTGGAYGCGGGQSGVVIVAYRIA